MNPEQIIQKKKKILEANSLKDDDDQKHTDQVDEHDQEHKHIDKDDEHDQSGKKTQKSSRTETVRFSEPGASAPCLAADTLPSAQQAPPAQGDHRSQRTKRSL